MRDIALHCVGRRTGAGTSTAVYVEEFEVATGRNLDGRHRSLGPRLASGRRLPSFLQVRRILLL
jgi:hypothetical protein